MSGLYGLHMMLLALEQLKHVPDSWSRQVARADLFSRTESWFPVGTDSNQFFACKRRRIPPKKELRVSAGRGGIASYRDGNDLMTKRLKRTRFLTGEG